MKYAFAGNRDIGFWVLEFLISKGVYPEFLVLMDRDSDEAKKMISISKLPLSSIVIGSVSLDWIKERLNENELDYIIGVHYSKIIPVEVLSFPKFGFLNLHPAYLPFNRGWHTPSWAIIEDTPYGATLHFMSGDIDMGDIVNRKRIKIGIEDSADSIYQKVKQLELQVFIESFPSLVNGDFEVIKQNTKVGSSHKRKELLTAEVSMLDLNSEYNFGILLNKLRALTTNRLDEACYFVEEGHKYRIQVKIIKE